MNDRAILKVTEALRDRLVDALDAAQLPDVVFVGPLDDVEAVGASLVLFLYRIVPNASLRNAERRVPSPNPPKVDTYRNAIPLDLHYLLTLGSDRTVNEPTGLQKLGVALQSLQVEPNLAGPEVDYEAVRVTLEPLSTEEASRIWSLFPTANYRTSLAFVASPVWLDPPTPDVPAKPVVDNNLLARRKAEEVGV